MRLTSKARFYKVIDTLRYYIKENNLTGPVQQLRGWWMQTLLVMEEVLGEVGPRPAQSWGREEGKGKALCKGKALGMVVVCVDWLR